MKLKSALDNLNNYIEGCYLQPSLQHQHLSGAGAVNNLAEKLCKFYSKKYCVTFCNATTAMQTVCLAMELQDVEILTSPINWGGSIAPLLLNRGKLRFISFDTISQNMDVRDLPSAITQKTKAVLSVDYNGIPVDSKTIRRFCSKHGLKYISDSAQSLGAYKNNKAAGYFADATILSFSPGKSLFCFEGGAVITDDENLYEKLIWYSQHPSKQKTVFGLSNYNEYALNGRMNPLSALLLNETFESSLKALKGYQAKCFQLLMYLQQEKLVESTPNVKFPQCSTFFNFSVQLKPSVSRQHVNDFLRKTKQPFIAIDATSKLIPFDPLFIKQFEGKYSCSNELKKQRLSLQVSNRAILIRSYENSPQ